MSEQVPKRRRWPIGCALALFGIVALPLLAQNTIFCGWDHSPIHRGNACVSETRNADLAFSKIMIDAQVDSIPEMFAEPQALFRPTLSETVELQSRLLEQLLRRGRDAELEFRSDIPGKLGTNYLDLHRGDPWGRRYYFYVRPGSPSPDEPAYYERLRRYPWGAPDQPVYIFSAGKDGRLGPVFTFREPVGEARHAEKDDDVANLPSHSQRDRMGCFR